MLKSYVGAGENGDVRATQAGGGTRSASVWTDRMVEALATREEWYSLIDKVTDARTLERAWARVAANDGAAGWIEWGSRDFGAPRRPPVAATGDAGIGSYRRKRFDVSRSRKVMADGDRWGSRR